MGGRSVLGRRSKVVIVQLPAPNRTALCQPAHTFRVGRRMGEPVYQIKAIEGDMLVLRGEATNRGNPLNGKTIVDQRKVKLQKVSAAFINALKGTP